jgi:hypothetical protein
MRGARYWSAVLLLVPALVSGQAPADEAATVLAAARQALGGDGKLAGIHSFTVTGRTQQLRGNSLVPIEFEIICELPDKYLRTDEVPAQESGPTSLGFSGDALIQLPLPSAAAGRRGGGPTQGAATEQTRAAAVRQDFARLAFGLFATSFASYPLSFTYIGRAEAPQGQADVLAATGPANFTMRVFLSRDSHLPLMVSWQMPATVRGAAPAGQPVVNEEHRLYYADYRDTNGLHWPSRLRHAIGSDTIDETTVDRFRVNTAIDPKKFSPK